VVGTSNWTLDDADHQVIERHVAKLDSFAEPPHTRWVVTGGGVYSEQPTLEEAKRWAEESLNELTPEANPNEDE
jgi:hypothetical protein